MRSPARSRRTPRRHAAPSSRMRAAPGGGHLLSHRRRVLPLQYGPRRARGVRLRDRRQHLRQGSTTVHAGGAGPWLASLRPSRPRARPLPIRATRPRPGAPRALPERPIRQAGPPAGDPPIRLRSGEQPRREFAGHPGLRPRGPGHGDPRFRGRLDTDRGLDLDPKSLRSSGRGALGGDAEASRAPAPHGPTPAEPRHDPRDTTASPGLPWSHETIGAPGRAPAPTRPTRSTPSRRHLSPPSPVGRWVWVRR